MNKRILIYTHNKMRDGPFDLILSYELRRRGHQVWSKNLLADDNHTICSIEPEIIIFPEIRNEYTVFLVRNAKQCGCQIVVKPGEVGISAESAKHISADYRDAIFGRHPVGDFVDIMFAWGPKMAELFSRFTDVPREKFVIVGGYLFDQYRLPKPPVDEKPTDKKIVLFATGFPYADRNPQYALPEAAANSTLHRELVEKDRNARLEWSRMIRPFIEKFKDDWHIYIKVHLGEELGPYAAAIRGLQAKLIHKESALMALQNVDVVIHSGSTMAYEAHLLNKPAINFRNITSFGLVGAISPNVSCTEDLIKTFAELELGKSNADPEVITVLERDYYGVVDGKGCQRICDAIDSLPPTTVSYPAIWPCNKEPKYFSEGVLTWVEVWKCECCKSQYYMTQQNRDMVKCPYCGIANIKRIIPTPPGAQNETMQKMRDAGHTPGHKV